MLSGRRAAVEKDRHEVFAVEVANVPDKPVESLLHESPSSAGVGAAKT
jgi:hypothetical protein